MEELAENPVWLVLTGRSESAALDALRQVPKTTVALHIIEFRRLGDDGARHIAEHLKNLIRLELIDEELGDDGARHIAEHLKTLTLLGLSGSHLGDNGARHIAENLRNLIVLDLSYNRFGVEGVRHITENLKNLIALNLSGNKVGAYGAQHIAKHLKDLTMLHLRGSAIGSAGAWQIAKHLNHLAWLDLAGNQIGDDGARHIAEHLKNLIRLDLPGNTITSDGARYIAEHLKSVTSLDLNNNRVWDDGARHIAMHMKELTSLSLSNNMLGANGARCIAEQLRNLTELRLASNRIGDDGARHIADHLKNLEWLDLSDNRIGDDGARYIVSHLKNLISLNLKGNVGDIPASASTDPNSLRAYFQTKDIESTVVNLTIRAMLIGEPEVGKTTLSKALTGTRYILGNENRTHGLERNKLELKDIKHTEKGVLDFIIDLWDMGGQSLQQMMHGFFFRSDAIYILLINEKSKPETIRPWLDQLKDQRRSRGKRTIIIPVANPTAGSSRKIPYDIIENLKREYADELDVSDVVEVDLTDTERPKIDDLQLRLRDKLRSFELNTYWKSIDDISKVVLSWDERCLSNLEFSKKLLKDSAFVASFNRIQRALTQRDTGEPFSKDVFARLILSVLDQKGLLRNLDKPDVVILDPVWLHKGLYSLLPPKDKALSASAATRAFLSKVSRAQTGSRLPGIFRRDDVTPIWNEWKIDEAEHEALLRVLCTPELGLVIRRELPDNDAEYFMPAYLDYAQEVAERDLADAIRKAYRTALCCMVFERDYWPPYLVYQHMVHCGASPDLFDKDKPLFSLLENDKGPSKQRYWIVANSNSDMTFELILMRNRLWCFGRSGEADNLPLVQDSMKDIKKELYRLLRCWDGEKIADMKTLVPCPECMNEILFNGGKEISEENVDQITANMAGTHFYLRETLIENRSSPRLLRCGPAPYHDATAKAVLEHLMDQNYRTKKGISLEHAVIVISMFAVHSGLASLQGKGDGKVRLCGTGYGKFKIQSIDPGTLKNLWNGVPTTDYTPHKLGAALIQRLACLSQLANMAPPSDGPYVRYKKDTRNSDEERVLKAEALAYLSSIAVAILKNYEECCEKLTGSVVSGQRLKKPSSWEKEFLGTLKARGISRFS